MTVNTPLFAQQAGRDSDKSRYEFTPMQHWGYRGVTFRNNVLRMHQLLFTFVAITALLACVLTLVVVLQGAWTRVAQNLSPDRQRVSRELEKAR